MANVVYYIAIAAWSVFAIVVLIVPLFGPKHRSGSKGPS